jgi:hypothetical protein
MVGKWKGTDHNAARYAPLNKRSATEEFENLLLL